MDTFSLIGFAVVTAILSCTVRQFNNAAGMNVALAGGAFILLSIIAKVSESIIFNLKSNGRVSAGQKNVY